MLAGTADEVLDMCRLLVLVVGSGLWALPAAALDTPAPPQERQVSLEARDEPLRGVLKRLTAGTDTVITVDPKVPDSRVRLAVRNVTVDHALRLIIRQAARDVPQIDYETAEHGFRVYFATPVATPVEKRDPSRVTITPRNQPAPPTRAVETPPEKPGPEPSPEAAGGFDALSDPGVPAGPYLIGPVAPYYLREALIPQVPRYQPGYYLPVIVGTKGKRRPTVSKQPLYFRQEVMSGRSFPGRYGTPGRRRNPGGGSGGSGSGTPGGPGGLGRRPF